MSYDSKPSWKSLLTKCAAISTADSVTAIASAVKVPYHIQTATTPLDEKASSLELIVIVFGTYQLVS
ncbi:MAG: hypothetical protein QXR45_12770 [Candidatus Bathyarchaeia archaeon]